MESEKIFLKILEIHDTNKLGLSDTPYGTDKLLYKSYFELLYPRLLSSLPGINAIVEIGVRGGASMYIWSLLYPRASLIGLDLVKMGDDSGPNPAYMSGQNTIFINGNAYTGEIANKVPDEIDLLIDDGSHYLKDQIKVLELYLDKLSEHGVLVIEDVQRGYRDAYRLLCRVPSESFSLSAHDYRFNKRAYDDFAVSVTRGRTPLARRIYYMLRSYTFLFEHVFLKLLNCICGAGSRPG